MARKGEIKGVEAIGSKTVDVKATDIQVRSSRKRQKTQIKSEEEPQDIPDYEQIKDPREDQVFRFMDLPGELRNRIYGHAADHAYRCFPVIASSKKGRKNYTDASSPSSESKSPQKLLPHIGLTQACSIIRSEFRPVWLSTHMILLGALDTYLKAYYPRINRPNTSLSTSNYLNSQFSASGSLRIWIRTSELENVDIIKLLKHAVRFPKFTISVHSLHDGDAEMVSSLQNLVSNKTNRWVRGIQGNKISRVLLYYTRFSNRPLCWIVVKEKFALAWMKPYLGGPDPVPEGYLESLGLEGVAKVWYVSFGVDYS